MKRARILMVPVMLALGTGVVSCELIENCLECLCPDLADGSTGITGNAKVDSFFAAAAALDDAADLSRAEVEEVLADFRVALGLPADASREDIRAAIDAAFAAASITFTFDYDPPECRADVDVAARAAAECDVTVDPGEVDVVCSGHCEGTCQASCTGECRMPSVEAYCEGSCHGSCYVDTTTECYGTCHGTCSGTCSYMEGSECAGSCSGTCTGRCETRIEGSCTGECSGECTVTADPGGCNGHCEGSCEGHCEGSCEGTVEPPEVDADCEATVEARVEASVECDPAEVHWGVDTSELDNIEAITYHMGRLIASAERAERISNAVASYRDTLNTAAEGIFSGELDSTELACALQQMPTAISMLGGAIETFAFVVETETIILI